MRFISEKPRPSLRNLGFQHRLRHVVNLTSLLKPFVYNQCGIEIDSAFVCPIRSSRHLVIAVKSSQELALLKYELPSIERHAQSKAQFSHTKCIVSPVLRHPSLITRENPKRASNLCAADPTTPNPKHMDSSAQQQMLALSNRTQNPKLAEALKRLASTHQRTNESRDTEAP